MMLPVLGPHHSDGKVYHNRNLNEMSVPPISSTDITPITKCRLVDTVFNYKVCHTLLRFFSVPFVILLFVFF